MGALSRGGQAQGRPYSGADVRAITAPQNSRFAWLGQPAISFCPERRSYAEILIQILRRLSDASIRFADLRALLLRLVLRKENAFTVASPLGRHMPG